MRQLFVIAVLFGVQIVNPVAYAAPFTCCEVETESRDRVSESESALTCTLTSKELRDRSNRVRALIAKGVLKTEEVDDGFIVTFKKGLGKEIAEFIELERECCAFFEFHLKFSANDGPIVLSVRGPEGSKAFSSKLFGDD